MKVLIIGAGQLGSRHLQALRNIKFNLDITVCDPSEDSLKVAKERFEAIPTTASHSIQFLTALPSSGSWDLSIVATNASQRLSVLSHTVEKLQIKNYILEKILFTQQSDYVWAKELSRGVLKNCWVNCCMRQMPIYNTIKSELNSNNFSFIVSGSNYGLITNAIHYLDYAAWLAGTSDFTLDTTQLITKAVPSKRRGYLELNGTLRANFKSGSVAQITCFEGGALPIVVEVHSDAQRHIVLESERKSLLWKADSNWVRNEREAIIPYQSQLTTESVNSIYESKPLSLTRLDESIDIHVNLLKPLKEFLIKTEQTQSEDYPFT